MGFADLLTACDRSSRDLLGGSVVYSPGAGVPVTVRGIFDAAYVRVDAGTAGVSSSGPAVFLKLADLPSNPETDTAATVTVASVVYTIREVSPDGTGVAVLHLHES